MDYFGKHYHPPGTSPGTLVQHHTAGTSEFLLRLIDYTNTAYVEKELATMDECLPFLERDSVTWIHMQGHPETDTLLKVGELFGLHPLAMEDVLNRGQRPKIEEYDGQLFIVMALPIFADKNARVEQISIFVGENYLISFHAGDTDIFEPLRKRLRKQSGRIRTQKSDYLLYSLLDLIIDQGYPLLETFGEEIELIEEELLGSANQKTLARIHAIRRELLLLRRMLWPQREILNFLMREGHSLIREENIIYLRDCYDHTIQIMDLIENYRDMAASMIDVYLSSVSHHLNEIMRVLTMIATIFIPLTFVVGVYGMNFSNPESPWAMPELHWYYGYPLVIGIMIAIVIGMVIYFKRKDWL